MSETESDTIAIMDSLYEPGVLPKYFSEYEIVSCLKNTDNASVYAVQKLGVKYILKCCRGTNQNILKNEYETLRSLDFTFLPRAFDFYRNSDGSWLLREYIEGATLADTVERYGVMSDGAAVDVMLKLCACLKELHSLSPSVIHRDVKPQNIAMCADGKLMIIDMGTARTLKLNASNDTDIMGTDVIAAPEQFGYSQTDERTDIYSAGLLLAFLLTGDYNSKKADISRGSCRMKTIIKTCSAFDPDRRYQSVQELERSLIAVKKVKKRTFIYAAVICIMIAGAALSFKAFNEMNNPAVSEGLADTSPSEKAETSYTANLDGVGEGAFSAEFTPAPVAFTEPLIEKAARYTLGFDEKRVIYEDDLLKVTSMLIIADEYMDYTERRYKYPLSGDILMEAHQRRGRLGGITSLEDMKYFKNMRKLGLVAQNITDVSPLSELPLEALWLGINPIRDISPLRDCVTLSELYLDSTNIADISPLENLTNITRIALDYTDITDLSPLKGMALTELYIQSYVQEIQTKRDYSIFAGMPLQQLIAMNLGSNQINDICEIKSLVYLFAVHSDGIDDFERFAKMSSLKHIVLFDTNIGSLSGVEKMPNLEELDFGANRYEMVLDIAPLIKAPKLKIVAIRGVEVIDYSPLLEIPNLEVVEIHREQAEKIYEAIPNPPFAIKFRD